MTCLNSLIDALREELTQYGEMLALLDQQQEAAISRRSDLILDATALIEAQGTVIQRVRQARATCHQGMLREVGQPPNTELLQLVDFIPEEYRPLLKALVSENNHLLVRIQQRTRQNHLLLSRSVESLRQLIGTLYAASIPALYNGEGQVLSLPNVGRQLWEAVG